MSASAAEPGVLDLQMVPLVTIHGVPGDTHQIQCSTTLGPGAVWVPLTNVVLLGGGFEFYDRISPAGQQRYYREVLAGAGQLPLGFAWLPPGQFTMGSPSAEKDRDFDEGPETIVRLSRGVFMATHELTQAEYQAVVGSNPSDNSSDPQCPVERVTWHEATNYCGMLTRQEQNSGRLLSGWRYRLPTEAEWEYAARAGTTSRFSYGDDLGYLLLRDYAWYYVIVGGTRTVGLKLPNPWGLYDMSGNVSEWCWDVYTTYYRGGTLTDPQGPDDIGQAHVIRGGGCADYSSSVRSASRTFAPSDARGGSIGFRVVLAPAL